MEKNRADVLPCVGNQDPNHHAFMLAFIAWVITSELNDGLVKQGKSFEVLTCD